MNEGPGLLREEFIERAAALVPVLRERAPETERAGRVSQQTSTDLRDAGLWRILRPERYDGTVTDFGVMVDVAIELARGCTSTAWVYINLIAHNWMLPYWPARAMEDIWGENPEALIGSTLVFPAGRLDASEDGYLFSGRWPYASGIDISDWMMLGALHSPDDGPPTPRIVIVRARDLDVHDTWQVSGLAGTGSKDVSCANLFVPAHMVYDPGLAQEGWSPGTEDLDGDAYRLPLIPFIPHLVVAPMLGTALAAYDAYVDDVRTQVSVHNRSKLAEHTTVQMKVAEAGVLIDSARLLVRESWSEAHRLIETSTRPSLETRARWRRDASYASGMCIRAVDLIYGVTGARANYLENDLQRRFRDIHAAAHQIHLSWDINASEFGRVALGLPATNALL